MIWPAISLILQLIGIAIPLLLGALGVRLLLKPAHRGDGILLFLLGGGTGIGLVSILWFLTWCIVPSVPPWVPLLLEFSFLAVLLYLWLPRRAPASSAVRSATAVSGWILTLAILSLTGAVFFFVRAYLLIPNGGWDAWAIWNLHARAIFLGGGTFWRTDLYKIGWTQPDYPELLPLSVLRIWFFSGFPSPQAPALVAFFFTFGTAGALATALARLKNRTSGLLALAVLLSSTAFLWLGVQEYADIPQSFFILATFVALALYELERKKELLILAGLTCGLAVWTKNEGWLFLGCLTGSFLIRMAKRPQRRTNRQMLTLFALGCLPGVAVSLLYKSLSPAHSDVLAWYLTRSGWTRLFDVQRLLFILRSFVRGAWTIESWFVSAFFVLGVYVLLVGVEKTRSYRETGATALLTASLMLAGYFLVYATSTSDLTWYLTGSLERVYLQLWPSFLFFFFLLTRTPRSGTTAPAPTAKTDTLV